jgi:hypothetical protein
MSLQHYDSPMESGCEGDCGYTKHGHVDSSSSECPDEERAHADIQARVGQAEVRRSMHLVHVFVNATLDHRSVLNQE